MAVLLPPGSGNDWLGLSDVVLPVELAMQWAVQPRCGAVVVFSGTVRDHADGRSDVERLVYEAYEEQVLPRLQTIASEMRAQCRELGRIVLLHRVGTVHLEEPAVVVVASAPHRDAAFDAARFGIDAVKATAPIWKQEVWRDGHDWGRGAQPIATVHEVR